jgi:glucose/arabinose dehydrogenase
VLAGRILRYNPDGTIPADNPIAGDPEWVRGLRNTFDLAVHPVTGGLFASENGAMANDEIEFVQKGKNYEWGATPGSIPPPQIGFRVITWATVIAPTGIAFYTGGGFGAGFDDNLFVLGYVGADIRRLALSGPALTDLDMEAPFASFLDVNGVDNKPLDIVKGADGALYVSTFTAIWRIQKSP